MAEKELPTHSSCHTRHGLSQLTPRRTYELALRAEPRTEVTSPCSGAARCQPGGECTRTATSDEGAATAAPPPPSGRPTSRRRSTRPACSDRLSARAWGSS
jgi:hypothetical protein